MDRVCPGPWDASFGGCDGVSRGVFLAQAQLEAQRATQDFQRATEVLRAAKETISLAEQRLLEDDKRQFDSAWQEMLNHATQRVRDGLCARGRGTGRACRCLCVGVPCRGACPPGGGAVPFTLPWPVGSSLPPASGEPRVGCSRRQRKQPSSTRPKSYSKDRAGIEVRS